MGLKFGGLSDLGLVTYVWDSWKCLPLRMHAQKKRNGYAMLPPWSVSASGGLPPIWSSQFEVFPPGDCLPNKRRLGALGLREWTHARWDQGSINFPP